MLRVYFQGRKELGKWSIFYFQGSPNYDKLNYIKRKY